LQNEIQAKEKHQKSANASDPWHFADGSGERRD
jgi:hypothetical protein